MDEQTGAEQAHAALRETVISPRQQDVALQPTEASEVAEPTARLQPMERGVPMAEPTARLQPMESIPLAEPTARLQPMERGVPMAEHAARLQPTESIPLAEPTARLQPMERGVPMAEPTARLRSDAVEASPTRTTALAATPRTATDAQVKRLAPTTGAATQSGGSAGSGFEVNPEQYRAAVSPVLAAADQLAQLVTGLSAFLDHTQSTAPWGNDESGKKFAEGEKGYLRYSTDTLKGLKGMPDAVRYVADGLKAMAENYRAAEEGTTSVFQGGGAEDVSVPQAGSYSAPVNVTSPGATLRNIAQAHPSTTRRA
ncbi:hypothetical protein [Kitasatospora sp. DSM 101779]|uniref:hypothetical protein n=1 Tax=Kitasatospora sp. DSM 101779 TaxID=2853165 RepID=UPI0021D82ADB|nr:hypothetical protein [Kitasatospora sp. DSM 101779]MCU7821056.1 hypothetical protein [Kitasatospora sp. DSM 101779]